jgi:hypothetical protein
MSDPIGYRRWAIPEGRVDERTSESVSILNASQDAAHVTVTVYFSQREPAGPYEVDVPARRAVQLRLAELSDPEPLPYGTTYGSVIESDVPVVIQFSRIDGSAPNSPFASTIAYAGD